MLRAHDDALGVLENMGLRPGGYQLYLTNSFAIAVVTAVLAGATLALAVGVAGVVRFLGHHYGSALTPDEPLFPSGSERVADQQKR
jgi:hypothetical protein